MELWVKRWEGKEVRSQGKGLKGRESEDKRTKREQRRKGYLEEVEKMAQRWAREGWKKVHKYLTGHSSWYPWEGRH